MVLVTCTINTVAQGGKHKTSNHKQPTGISTNSKLLFKLQPKEHAMCYDTINDSISNTNQ